MKNIITTNQKPIKCWLDNIEESALAQANNLANLPFTFKHVALMPDCHVGYGMPIGAVLATKDVVIPNAVGVDIGCGMCAVSTNLKDIPKDKLLEIVNKIKRSVPVGFKHQKEPQDIALMPVCDERHPIVNKEFYSARHQLGTLGGGNHFIEIQKDNDGVVWIMNHSGSRNLGKKVADHYNKEAVKLNERWFSKVEKSMELAFLPIDTEQGKQYLNEMQYCIDFALANRKLMMERIKACFAKVLTDVSFGDMINIAHNYAAFENHFGCNVIVHRKGATYAGQGNIGIIPGSQGTKSYIVRGLGNPESFFSCSHGAGRRMGRKEAQRKLDLKSEIKLMEEKGIIHGIKTVSDLDEAASAYKDIDVVMQNQQDLVEIVVELSPLAVIKG
ncbi:MAG TPA: RtcB family protein [Bacteroidaceae bacterium]|nr:RtcB family protein [Bacteroidaceae bacterium]